MLDFETSSSKLEVSKSDSMENYFFLKDYVTLEGVVSHNVLYNQPLPITCYQVRPVFHLVYLYILHKITDNTFIVHVSGENYV